MVWRCGLSPLALTRSMRRLGTYRPVNSGMSCQAANGDIRSHHGTKASSPRSPRGVSGAGIVTFVEPILVAAIAAVASIIGGLIGGALRHWGEDWVARQREAREADREQLRLRRERLDGLWKWIADAAHFAGAREVLPAHVSAIGDPDLDAHVGRMLTSPTPEERESAKNDALRRVGELLRVPQRR